MNVCATAALEELRKTEWFRNVGVRDSDSAILLSSWEEALALCTSPEWESVRLEASNQIRDKVGAVSSERYCRWNDITGEAKRIVVPIVQQKCEPVSRENGLPDAFFFAVRWDMVGLFLELEYSDIALPAFYHSQWEWYMKG